MLFIDISSVKLSSRRYTAHVSVQRVKRKLFFLFVDMNVDPKATGNTPH